MCSLFKSFGSLVSVRWGKLLVLLLLFVLNANHGQGASTLSIYTKLIPSGAHGLQIHIASWKAQGKGTQPRSLRIEHISRRKKRGYTVLCCHLCWWEFWFFFVSFNFSPKKMLNIPPLLNVLFLILKKTCVVFLGTFGNFFFRLTGSFSLRESWWRFLFILFPFFSVYNVRRSYCSFSCITVATSCNGSASRGVRITKARNKGTLPFYNQSFDFHGLFSFYCIALLVIIIQLTAV